MISSENIRVALERGTINEILSVLYENVLKKASAYIEKNNGRKEDAEDIFQDMVCVAIDISTNPEKQDIDNIEGFLMRSIKNRWINLAIRNNKLTDQEFDIPTDDKIEENIITKEKENALKIAFDKIGETCASILTMYYFENQSLEKIAQTLGFSNAETVRSKSYQCKKKLSKVIVDSPLLNELLAI